MVPSDTKWRGSAKNPLLQYKNSLYCFKDEKTPKTLFYSFTHQELKAFKFNWEPYEYNNNLFDLIFTIRIATLGITG